MLLLLAWVQPHRLQEESLDREYFGALPDIMGTSHYEHIKGVLFQVVVVNDKDKIYLIIINGEMSNVGNWEKAQIQVPMQLRAPQTSLKCILQDVFLFNLNF